MLNPCIQATQKKTLWWADDLQFYFTVPPPTVLGLKQQKTTQLGVFPPAFVMHDIAGLQQIFGAGRNHLQSFPPIFGKSWGEKVSQK